MISDLAGKRCRCPGQIERLRLLRPGTHVAYFGVVGNVEHLMARAEAALLSDELGDARDAFERVLEMDPANDLAKRGILEVTRELLLRARRAGVQKSSRLHLTGAVSADARDEAEMDVLAALAKSGDLSIAELGRSTGLGGTALLAAVTTLVEDGFVAV